MNQVRSVFNSFKNSERYSRFTLQTEPNGERRVEVKLSEDGVDEDAEGGAGGSPTFRPAPRGQSRRNLFFLIMISLLVFLIGYMIAFLIHGKGKKAQNCKSFTVENNSSTLPYDAHPSKSFNTMGHKESNPILQLTWFEITELLKTKLTSMAFDNTLRDYDRRSRMAGSDDDVSLGRQIFDKFKKLKMEPWTDIHHIRLQTPDNTKPNKVTFGSNLMKPQGFLAYSGTGTAQGKLVYANYGRPEDFKILSRHFEVKNCVVILRSGKIGFAQKVANAEERGALAVLIYPDIQDYNSLSTSELYGHVHFGSGDPYTPGFPSINNTQFPPTKSAGLPNIPAQTLTFSMARTIMQDIGGPVPDKSSGFAGGQTNLAYSLGGVKNITVEVNNVLVFKEISNVFGVIKGFVDPDRYIVLGAQRDAWGKGYTRANVGTSALIELARAIQEMVEKDGFRPRRSIVFASWSAGEYGSVGATEWLEAHSSSIDSSVISYISLDGIVQGLGSFYASGSPLLQNVLESAMKTVRSPTSTGNVWDLARGSAMRPMSMDDPAYPFLASFGIPSVSFHFVSPNRDDYQFYFTHVDGKDELDYAVAQQTTSSLAIATQLAGQMALRLVHDHLLNFDVNGYKKMLNGNVYRVNQHVSDLNKSGQLKDISANWLYRAKASFQRAASALDNDIKNTLLDDPEACRLLNDRLMKIEHTLLSPYVSPVETPYRHLLFGKGPHTLAAISEMTDMNQLHTQLALATWNLQGCANAMVGDLWDIDNEI